MKKGIWLGLIGLGLTLVALESALAWQGGWRPIQQERYAAQTSPASDGRFRPDTGSRAQSRFAAPRGQQGALTRSEDRSSAPPTRRYRRPDGGSSPVAGQFRAVRTSPGAAELRSEPRPPRPPAPTAMGTTPWLPVSAPYGGLEPALDAFTPRPLPAQILDPAAAPDPGWQTRWQPPTGREVERRQVAADPAATTRWRRPAALVAAHQRSVHERFRPIGAGASTPLERGERLRRDAPLLAGESSPFRRAPVWRPARDGAAPDWRFRQVEPRESLAAQEGGEPGWLSTEDDPAPPDCPGCAPS